MTRMQFHAKSDNYRTWREKFNTCKTVVHHNNLFVPDHSQKNKTKGLIALRPKITLVIYTR